ncbi:RNase P subunit p30 family protein [Vulcanisaeta thermophila]|uniref:RNase P subunit p30 family protein n=1 Tax=Vulcanisaeta thermophila TaxID=867917 RepID=UPI000853A4A7|nr:RNase P subunit p30 family protein [Vulcanisaeta thermophila]
MFVEFHINTLDPRVIHIMRSVGYSVLVTTATRQPDNPELPIFTKLVLTQGSMWRVRLARRYDVVSVIPWSRFVLNKLITDERIDVITINTVNREVTPSKAQARVMAREGKALEFVLKPIISMGEAGLLFLRNSLMEYMHIDGLRVIVSQGVDDVYDVRNPRDVVALLSLLTGMDVKELSSLVGDNPMGIISDAIYRRGLCVGGVHGQGA